VKNQPRAHVALVGTTASGKSSLAHCIAKDLGDVDIGTVDSMTVYREMDIGTAKASTAERSEVTYHLVDLVDPNEEFTVAQFQRAAQLVESDVAQSGRRLLYVGGTGLYGRAVFDGFEIPGQFLDVREELERRASNDLAALYLELQERDPLAASRMQPTNERRIVRALEVTLGSNRPFSSFGPGLARYDEARIAQVGVRRELDDLDRRISERFNSWMGSGFLDEVDRLRQRPDGLSRTARQAVGYRELLQHFEEGLDLETAVASAISATRRLARRQRSWFARDPRIEWFDSDVSARNRVIELFND
jgi:tRNA dimethylallyltransferase